MTPEEHEFFHRISLIWQQLQESKFELGATEHRHIGNLWEMTDEELHAAETEELIDLSIYRATRLIKAELKEKYGADNRPA